MDRITFAAVLILSVLTIRPAAAQQGASSNVQTEAPPAATIITTAPNQSSARQVYFQSDLDDLNNGIDRTRVALISTSAVTAVGIILTSIGASQCTYYYYSSNYYDYSHNCNTAGNVLVPMGATFLSLGAIGMITSGIMLGVKKGKRRRLQRDMRQSAYGARLQWDVDSGRLVF
ncbi:MAG: hypothetical protein WCF10_03790 [Polyangiales bacterium]